MAYTNIEDQRAACRKHYQENKDYYRERNQARKERARTFVQEQKDVPCADCGRKYPPYVMDFDHRDPTVKVIEVGAAAHRGWSFDALKEEMKKCDVVCANCHRERTHCRIVQWQDSSL